MKKIALFASGEGTNAEAIAKYLSGNKDIEVALVATNRKGAGVHARMQRLGIPTVNFPKDEWLPAEDGGQDGANVLKLMQEKGIGLIVLAGFLAMVPKPMLEAYKGRIINIHPSLLPKHGGKGMWGHHVHDAVLAAGDKESGITIHQVTEVVDGGEILFQTKCPVMPDDTADTLAARVHVLEHKYFPQVVEEMANKLPCK